MNSSSVSTEVWKQLLERIEFFQAFIDRHPDESDTFVRDQYVFSRDEKIHELMHLMADSDLPLSFSATLLSRLATKLGASPFQDFEELKVVNGPIGQLASIWV